MSLNPDAAPAVESDEAAVSAAEAVAAEPEAIEDGVQDESAPDAGAEDVPDEGDLAADYIEELLDICDLDGDIDIESKNGRNYVSVTAGQDSNVRILAKPDVVAALQELTRLAVQNSTGEFSRLVLDIAGSRDLRAQELSELVERAIAKLEAGASRAALPPMSSYERKLVHDLVGEHGYHSESEGEGRDRHTVITAG